jgi:glycosyltransferase involved in cell wall biosynthesis
MTNTVSTSKPRILFIHNRYLHQGGEDVVVHNEMYSLQKHGYSIFYKEFNNAALQGKLTGPAIALTKLFFNIAAFFEIFLLIKRQQIQIVHVHNLFYSASPSVLWAAKLAGAKTIFTLHNYRLFCLNGIFFRSGKQCYDCHTARSFQKGIEEKCFKHSGASSYLLAKMLLLHRNIGTWKKKVDTFIVINPFMHTFLEDIGVASNKIIYKPNMLPHHNIATGKHYADRDNCYLFVGRLSVEKGIEHLIEAFQQSDQHLIIVGEGELAEYVKSHVTQNIHYKGALPKDEVFTLYKNCKALIFPSLWIEGMPMTLIEAACAGIIPIAAASDNTSRLIEHGNNGFLYEAGNPAALAATVHFFETIQADALNTISENIRQHFTMNYSESEYLKAAQKIYQL